MKKIFAFWQSDKEMPGYLQLCIKTWYKNIPNLEVHILNHANLEEYLPGVYNLEQLKKLSYAKQSDAISVAVLEKHGGLFIDVDTIITDNVFDIFQKYDEKKLLAFGFPPNRGAHVAVLYVGIANNPLLSEWRKQIQVRLENIPENNPWNYIGNAVLDPLLKNSLYQDDFYIIDRSKVGNILESILMRQHDAINGYKQLFFQPNASIDALTALNSVKYGIVSLHNSWTPKEFSDMSLQEFLDSKCFLSSMLSFILYDRKFEDISNFYTEVSDRNSKLGELSTNKIWSKSIYVIDFKDNDCHYAFDLVQDVNSNKYYLDLILRNDHARKVLKIFKLLFNKTRLGSYSTINELMDSLNKHVVFLKVLVNQNNSLPVLKIYQEQTVYCDVMIKDKILGIGLNMVSKQILIYFRDKSTLDSLENLLRLIDSENISIRNNMFIKNVDQLTIDEQVNSYLKFVINIKDLSDPTRLIPIGGNYYQLINNNEIVAPKNLSNCKVQFHGKNNKLIIHKQKNLANLNFEFLGNDSIIEISEDVSIKGQLRIGHQSTIIIGENSTSTNPVYFTCAENTRIEIGKDCMFATNNQIRTDDAHPIYSSITGERINISKDIIIGNHVWIGYGATILSGAKVDDGSIIGMGSIVKGVFPNNCVIAGIPAKILKRDVFWERPLLLRESEVIKYSEEELLLKSYCQVTKN